LVEGLDARGRRNGGASGKALVVEALGAGGVGDDQDRGYRDA
jgi:hypothetical protein